MNDFETLTWSYSRLSLYERCPCAFDLAYNKGEPSVATEAMQRGKLVHQAVQRYAEACWRKGRKPVKRDFDIGRAIADGYPAQADAIRQFVENTGWEWGTMYGGEEGTCPVETMYCAPLPCGDLFRGRIDLLQKQSGIETRNFDPMADNASATGYADEWWLTDYKTGFATYGEEAIPDQLLYYAWLVQQTYPDAVNFSLCIDCVGVPWSPKPWTLRGDLAWIGDRIQARADRIVADSTYEPNVGLACKTCSYVMACTYAKSATVTELRRPAGEVGREAVLAEAGLSAAKKMLKAAAEAEGPIATGEGAWGYKETLAEYPWDVRTLIATCREYDFDPLPFIDITASQYSKLRDAAEEAGLDDMLVALAECTQVKRSLAFGFHKAAEVKRGATPKEVRDKVKNLVAKGKLDTPAPPEPVASTADAPEYNPFDRKQEGVNVALPLNEAPAAPVNISATLKDRLRGR